MDSLVVLPIRFIATTTDRGMFETPEILDRAERASFFVAGGNNVEDLKVHDVTPQFRALLRTINRTVMMDPAPNE